MRKILYDILENSNKNNNINKYYNLAMIVIVTISLIPLCTHKENVILNYIDKITLIIFALDYILRLITADYKIKKGRMSFLLYIITPMAIIDLLSILPILVIFPKGLELLRIFRLIKSLKIMRALKLFRYSSNVKTIINVIKNKKGILLTVAWFSFTYIFISALIMFNVEPETFPNLFDAVYWAVVSLTTVGYGDIYATTTIGKIAAITSSILGIAIIALPTGIITASYQEELQKQKTLINKRQRRKKIKNTYITKKKLKADKLFVL